MEYLFKLVETSGVLNHVDSILYFSVASGLFCFVCPDISDLCGKFQLNGKSFSTSQVSKAENKHFKYYLSNRV